MLRLLIIVAILAGSSTACPKCLSKKLVKCFADPCQFQKCGAEPDSNCVADFCGGCNYIFVKYGQIISGCSRSENNLVGAVSSPQCSERLSLCAKNPCHGVICRSCERAVCVPNYCGGCGYDFFYNGQKVKGCSSSYRG